MGEGAPGEEPLGGGRRSGVTTGFLGVLDAPAGVLDASQGNLLRPGRHARRTLPPTLSSTQRISPTRFSPAELRAVYVLPSFPCGDPHPRPVGQSPSASPLPEAAFCGLDVSQSLSTPHPPSQCLAVGLPCRLYAVQIRGPGAK